jgi:hypothetical protein
MTKIKIYCFRNLEDFVTWIDTSAIKKHIRNYTNTVCIIFLLHLVTKSIHFYKSYFNVYKNIKFKMFLKILILLLINYVCSVIVYLLLFK